MSVEELSLSDHSSLTNYLKKRYPKMDEWKFLYDDKGSLAYVIVLVGPTVHFLKMIDCG